MVAVDVQLDVAVMTVEVAPILQMLVELELAVIVIGSEQPVLDVAVFVMDDVRNSEQYVVLHLQLDDYPGIEGQMNGEQHCE